MDEPFHFFPRLEDDWDDGQDAYNESDSQDQDGYRLC